MSELVGYNPYETQNRPNVEVWASTDRESDSGGDTEAVQPAWNVFAENRQNEAGFRGPNIAEVTSLEEMNPDSLELQELKAKEAALKTGLEEIIYQQRAVERLMREVEYIAEQVFGPNSQEQSPKTAANLSEVLTALAVWRTNNNLFPKPYREEGDDKEEIGRPKSLFLVRHIPDFLRFSFEEASKSLAEGNVPKAEQNFQKRLAQLGVHIQEKMPRSLDKKTEKVAESWQLIKDMRALVESLATSSRFSKLPPDIQQVVLKQIGKDSKLDKSYASVQQALDAAKHSMTQLGESLISRRGNMDHEVEVQRALDALAQEGVQEGHQGGSEKVQYGDLHASRRRIQAVIGASIADAFEAPNGVRLDSPEAKLAAGEMAGSVRWVSRELEKIAEKVDKVESPIRQYVWDYRDTLKRLETDLREKLNSLGVKADRIKRELKALEERRRTLELKKRGWSLDGNGGEASKRITWSI